MIQFQRITVPLSLSESDAGLLRYAALVSDLGITSEIRCVHILTPARAESTADTPGDVQRRMEAEVALHFGAAAEDVAVSCHVVEGNRVDRLVEFSIEHRADLILLGHRKSRTGRRSLAQRLAMVTPCSVWLVPEGSADRITRIMAPVDFSDHSADSLGVATALARLVGLDACEALHVHFDPSTVRYDEQVEANRGLEKAAFSAFLGDVNTHGVDIDPTFMESSQPAEAILRRAALTQTDLIVMSTRGRSVAAAILLGSETAQVMVEATAPVLAVKHFGAHLNLFEALRASKFWARPNLKTN
jgi:SulP family sulfate permease